MKRKLYLNALLYFIFGFVLVSVVANFEFAEAKSDPSEKVSCGKILSDGDIQVFETVECGQEKAFSDDVTNSAVYKKTVSLTKQFKKRTKDSTYETQAEIKQKFIFTYDKKEKSEILPQNISSTFTVTKWKISPLSKISIDDGVCSVSNQYRVYDKNLVGNYQYMCDGFVDIFCDCNGEIGMNSDVKW